MTEKRYCIVCGKEFQSDDPAVVFCPDHRESKASPTETSFPEATHSHSDLPAERISEINDITSPWQPGQILLDTYQVVNKLGQGGMGVVYRVHHAGWDMDLAVKQPKSTLFTTSQGKEDFIREAETWANLGLHPHITTCYYVRTIDSIPHVFAEYIEGGSLEDWIQKQKGQDLYKGSEDQILARILDITIQFAWGLVYAHQQGLVHQDVKPLNVLMTPEGVTKVTDFGLTRGRSNLRPSPDMRPSESLLVSAGAYTPAYASPEQTQGEKLSLKTDIWSWAVSILEMFTGGVTWYSGLAAGEAFNNLQRSEPKPGIPKMPSVLAELLQDCFQENPGDRPSSMDEIASQLLALYEDLTGTAYPREKPKPVELRADSLNNKALSLLDLGKAGQAIKLLKQALEIDPVHPQATYNLGLLQWQRGDLDDLTVISRMEQALASQKQPWPAAYLLGWIHYQRGALEEAKKQFQSVLSYSEAQNTLNLLEAQLPGTGQIKAFTKKRYTTGYNALTYCPDGLRFVAATWKNIDLWDINSEQLIHTFEGHKTYVNCLAISPDGTLLLSGSGAKIAQGNKPNKDNSVRLWDLDNGVCLAVLNGHTRSVYAVAFHPDGTHVFSGSNDHTIRLWDINSKRCTRVYEGHKLGVKSLCLSPDGSQMLSGSARPFMGLEDNTIRLWDVESGECLHIFEGHQDAINALAMSPDGSFFISGSRDKILKVWDLQSRQCIQTLKGHHYMVSDVVITPDGKFALSSSNSGKIGAGAYHNHFIRLWDLGKGICLRSFKGHPVEINALALSPEGENLISAGDEKEIRFWALSAAFNRIQAPFSVVLPISAERALQQEQAFTEKIRAAQKTFQSKNYHKARELVVQLQKSPGYERDQEVIDLWVQLYRHCPHGALINGYIDKEIPSQQQGVNDFAFNSDGTQALTAGNDATVRLWNMTTGECLRVLKGFKRRVISVAFSPDDHWALAGGDNQNAFIRLWDLSTENTHSPTYRIGRSIGMHQGVVKSVAFSPDSRLVASGSDDKRIHLIDTATGYVLRYIRGHQMGVTSIAFSPDGSQLLSASGCLHSKMAKDPPDYTLKLWDVASGECLRTFEGHRTFINRALFAPNGKAILSASADRTFRIWDVKSGECIRTIECDPPAPFDSIDISPDGRHVASSNHSLNKVLLLNIWDLKTGECVRQFESHPNIRKVVFSPDGCHLLTQGQGSTFRIWTLDWDLDPPQQTDWHERACPYLEQFLTLHTPFAAPLPDERRAPDEEVTLALTHKGKPQWSEEDFQGLLVNLGRRGFGWLKPEGVRAKLFELAEQR
jgi:WD40 repeat protein/serine/threonine protein kinase